MRSLVGGVQRYAAARRQTDPVGSTVLEVAGLGLLSYGVWTWLHPLGLVVGGVSLVLMGYLSRPQSAR